MIYLIRTIPKYFCDLDIHWLYHSVLFFPLFLYGCTDNVMNTSEFPSQPQASGEALVHLQIQQKAVGEMTVTRAFDDSSIRDIHVLVYNSQNELTGHAYGIGNGLTLRAESGSGCTLFAVANTGNATLFDGETASTLSKLKALVSAQISSVEGVKNNDCLLMSGSLNNVTLNGGTAVQTITGLTVERLAAKITMDVTTAAGISITGYSIKNLPGQSYLTARPNANEDSSDDLAVGDDVATSWFDQPEVSATSIKNLSFYMYENRCGDRVAVNSTTGDLTAQLQKALYAPEHATYVEIYTKGYGYTATYKVYLGADNCRNYNVKRNGNYTCNVSMLTATSVDTRVSKIAEPSNCYMVATDEQVVFPVSRANEDGTTRISNLSSGWTVELLWTDNIGGMKADGTSCIKSVTAQLSNGTIKVETGSAEGNAVVVAKVGGIIVWSWHIWITNYDPETNNVSYNNGTKTTVFMNRNLGAKNNTVANVGSYGLFYQWGRKDPFPASSTLTSTTSASIYNAGGTKLTESGTSGTGVKLVQVPVSNNLSNSITNPLTFYYGKSSRYDWYTSGTTQNANLWNSTSGAKTVYDPCPYGWRVPTSGATGSSPWYSSTSSNYTNLTFTNGWNWTKAAYNLGWYPAIGYRSYNGGTFNSYVGARGYYWTATVNSNNAYSLYLRSNSVNPSYTSSQYRASGYAVRCVKE